LNRSSNLVQTHNSNFQCVGLTPNPFWVCHCYKLPESLQAPAHCSSRPSNYFCVASVDHDFLHSNFDIGFAIGNSPDKLRHTRSVAYSVELVVLNKNQISERLPYRYYTKCNLCWISNNRTGVASISTDIFRAVPIR